MFKKPRRSLVQWALEEVQDANLSAEPIDRDAAWKAKCEALEVIFAAGRSRARQRDFERFRAEQGEGLERFALWSALIEKYGPQEDWPAWLRDAGSAHVANETQFILFIGQIIFYHCRCSVYFTRSYSFMCFFKAKASGRLAITWHIFTRGKAPD